MPTMSPHIAIAWVSAKVTAAIRRATRNTTFAEHGIVYKVIDENEIIDSARQGVVKTAIAHVLALSCNSSHCGSSKWRHMISCYLLIARKRQWCLSSRLEAKCHWGERLAWLYDFCLKRSIQKWGERSQRKHWMNENKGVNWGSEFRCSYGGCKMEIKRFSANWRGITGEAFHLEYLLWSPAWDKSARSAQQHLLSRANFDNWFPIFIGDLTWVFDLSCKRA
jgi:hypothetical protein